MIVVPKSRVTLGGFVLLDWDDYTQSESDLQRDFAVLPAAEVINAPYARQRGGTNVSHRIRFERVKICASPAAARALKFSHTAALPIEPALLSIELHGPGSERWTMAETVLQPGFICRAESERFIAAYTLVGGQLVQIVAADGEGVPDAAGGGSESSEGLITSEGSAPLLGEDLTPIEGEHS